jgi:small subunit ribosomal protein S16
MAVKMRLSRAGAKKGPFYHVVVADERMPRDGRFIEQVGTVDPGVEPPAVHFDQVRVEYWLQKGAQPSEAVSNLLKQQRAAATK